MADETPQGEQEPQAVLRQGPDGQIFLVRPGEEPPSQEAGSQEVDDSAITDLVEEPAKVMRIGRMISKLLDEVKEAPLDDASRRRLRGIYAQSVNELTESLAPEIAQELKRITEPFGEDATPSDAELRIAQAQLVGWLEGLFQGIQTALVAQQMAARSQLEHMRRALPPSQGQQPGPQPGPGMYL